MRKGSIFNKRKKIYENLGFSSYHPNIATYANKEHVHGVVSEAGVAVHAYNPNTWDEKARLSQSPVTGTWQVQDQSHENMSQK